MTLRRPTAREYAIVGGINVLAVAFVLWRGHAWMAAYFGLLTVGAFWSALRATG